MKKRSQSGIITAVILIVIVIISVIVMWNVIYSILKKSSPETNIGAFTAQLNIEDVKLYVIGGAQVRVSRTNSKGEITSLKFIFEKNNGDTKIITRTDNIPYELEAKYFYFNSSAIGDNAQIKKVSVIPVTDSKSGMPVSESENSIQKNSDGERALDSFPGLISWWKFDGNLDDSIGKNQGIAETGLADTAGNVLTLDGFDDSVYFHSGTGEFNLTKERTIMLWFKPKGDLARCNSNPCYVGLLSHGFRTPTSSYYLTGYYNGNNNIKFGFFDSATPVRNRHETGNFQFDLYNNWYHAAGTYKYGEDNNLKLYINGNLNSEITDNTKIGTSLMPLRIGKFEAVTFDPGYFNGYIDDAMIFNRSLSLNEIQFIYNNQAPNHQ